MNVIVGERYKEAPDEVIQLALGYWGKEPVTDMDREVRAKFLGRSRAREWARWEQPQPSLQEVRAKLGESISDEELILRVYAGDEAAKVLGKFSSPEEYLSARHPLVMLVEELSKKRDLAHVVVRMGELTLSLRRGAHSDSAGSTGMS